MAQRFDWQIANDASAVLVWPADLPGIAKREAFEVVLTEHDLLRLYNDLRAHQLELTDRTGGL